ncbi:hypothetical protein [Synechococcus sp. MIT S9504]|uniref:hypothetical protein n=1 Tax=Synechococcus sp. MIT S9504 TaxID=1801628 RepID=UPI000ACA4DC7|nr:hypothetical protein [Synechococcus sp. MIT S9504]
MNPIDSGHVEYSKTIALLTHTKFSALSYCPENSASISDDKNLEISDKAGTMGDQQTRSSKRVLFFDQIKALMIALVIAIHVLSTFIFSFMGVHFTLSESLHPVFGGIAIWLLLFCNAFFMYMLFLLSG